MALLIKDVEEKEYVQIPNQTAKAVEEKNNDNPISLEALGLLVNLWSYDITTWEIHKTELYKRFAKNKKTSVTHIWDELVKAKYIIEFKYRNGRKWEYVYIYRIKPYTDQEIEAKLAECVELAGVSSTADFQHLKLNSSKSTVQTAQISNTISKQDTINKKQINKKSKENKTLNIFDDEKEPFEGVNIFAFKEFVKEFQENFPNIFDNEKFNAIYEQMEKQELRIITYEEAVKQAKYMKERESQGKLTIGDYAAYFVGGIKKKRLSEESALIQRQLKKIEKELRKQKDEEENESQENNQNESSFFKKEVPFYNWLEE